MNLENFNHKAQSSHSNDSAFLFVFIPSLIKCLLRVCSGLDVAPGRGSTKMEKTAFEGLMGEYGTGTKIKSYSET